MPNREQRRRAGKGQDDTPMDVAGIVVHFQNGQYLNLDTNKVQVVDKDTNRPIFQEVLEPVPQQIEDTNLDPSEVKPKGKAIVNVTPVEPSPTDNYTVQFDTPEGKMEYVKNGNWSGVRPVK